MSRNKGYPRNGGMDEAYPRPPKPPAYHRPSKDHKDTFEYNFQDKNPELTLPRNEKIKRIKIRDYANFENFGKGGRRQSKKEEFYQKVRKMDPRKGHELPYETLHPDDGSKHAGYQGGKIKTFFKIRVRYLKYKICVSDVGPLKFEFDS